MHGNIRWARIAALAAILLPAAQQTLAVDQARIFVYARRHTAARSWLAGSCDGAVVAMVRQGAYFAVNVSPGRHELGVQNGVPVFVEVRTGEEHFVRLDWNYEVGRPPIPILSKVSRAQADLEMRFLSYVEARRVRSNSVPKADPRQLPSSQLKTR